MKIERPLGNQPIPPDAKIVFKGVIFDIYQWEQEMFDGTKAVFEKAKRADTVEIIPVMEDGRILLIEEEQPGKKPFVMFPGGRVEEGEDPAAAAKRELLEETGYNLQGLALWKSVQPVSKLDWAVYTFIGRGCKKVQEPALDAGEKIKPFLATFDEFLDLAAADKFYEALTIEALQAKLDPQKKEGLRKLFLG